MSIPDQEIETAILSWISIFPEISTIPKNFDSLSDAITLTEMMAHISPNTFNVMNLSKEASEDWALKLTNLTYFCKELEKYYFEVLGKAFDNTYVDIVKVSKNEDKDQLHNLVELVLGAAVQCEDKEFYINAILTLDESCQNALMFLIEKVLTRCHQDSPDQKDGAPETPTDLFQRSSLPSAMKPDVPVKSLLAKIEELENENHQLGHRVSDLVQERENMKIKVNELIQEVHKKNEDVRSLVLAKEGVLEKLHVQETHEDLKNDMKLRDFKIEELTRLIDEIKQKHQIEISRMQDELDEQRRKIIQASKMEATMEFYKQKYEDYSRVSLQLGEMEKQSTMQRSKIEELTAYNENLSGKVNTYRDKIEAEKTRNITLDIELTRKNTEIDNLKNEKKRLEASISEIEQNVHELNKEIEKYEREHENNTRMLGGSIGGERSYNNKVSGQDFHEIIMNLEKENEYLKLKQQDGTQSITFDDGETEILKKENEILKNKCRQIEVDNENLRKVVAKSEDIKYVEKITNDNQTLKQEVEKVKKNAANAKIKAQMEIKALKESTEKPKSIERIEEKELEPEPEPEQKVEEKQEIINKADEKVEKRMVDIEAIEKVEKLVKAEKEAYNKEVEKTAELKQSNERLQNQIEELTQKMQEVAEAEKKVRDEKVKENIAVLKGEITTKDETINKLSEKISELQASVQTAQILEERMEKKESQVKELIEEIDTIKQVIETVGEQKEEELRVLTTALHEIAIRNTRLEKEISALKSASDFVTSTSKSKIEFNKKSQRV